MKIQASGRGEVRHSSVEEMLGHQKPECSMLDLNQRPFACEANALPTELIEPGFHDFHRVSAKNFGTHTLGKCEARRLLCFALAELSSGPDSVHFIAQIAIETLCDRSCGVAQLLSHELERSACCDAGATESVTDAVKRSLGCDAVSLLHSAKLLAERDAVPGCAAIVEEDDFCLWCGHDKLFHPAGRSCLFDGCECERFEKDNGFRDQSNDLGLLGVPSALVLLDSPDACVEIHLRPFGFAQLRQPTACVAKKFQNQFVLLVRQVFQFGKTVVRQIRSAFGLGVPDLFEWVAVDAFGIDGPLKAGSDHVGLGATGADRLPAWLGFNPVGEMKGLGLGDRQIAMFLLEQGQDVHPLSKRLRAMQTSRLGMAQVERDYVTHGERGHVGSGECVDRQGPPKSSVREGCRSAPEVVRAERQLISMSLSATRQMCFP